MNFTDKLKGKCVNRVFTHARYDSDSIVVKGGLASTPSQMLELASKGVPISENNVSNFFDGEKNPSWDVPLYRQRNVDIADVWQAEQDAKKVLKKIKK